MAKRGIKKQYKHKRFNPKMNIKKGDMVVVIAGDSKDRTKQREVKQVNAETGRVLVDGVNIVTKHKKPDAQNPDGGIVKVEAPISISNVMLVDPKSGEATRVGRSQKDGKSVRISKKSQEVID